MSPLYQSLKMPDYSQMPPAYAGPSLPEDPNVQEAPPLSGPQIPLPQPPAVDPDMPLDSAPPPVSAAPVPGSKPVVPDAYPTDPDGKKAFLNLLQGKFAGAADQGFSDYKDNRVTKDDLDNQRAQASANNLLAGLSQSAQKIGNFQGKVSDSTIPDFVKGQNQINQDFLKGREGLSDEGYKNAAGAVKGIEGIDTQQDTLAKMQAETDARKAAAKQAAVKADPNSDISQFYRDNLKKMGVNVGDNISAAQIEPKFANLQGAYEKDQDRQLKEKVATMDLQAKHEDVQSQIQGKQQDRAAQREFLQANKDQAAADREAAAQEKHDAALSDKDTKRFDTLNKALTDEIQSGRSTVGRASTGILAANSVDTLIKQAEAQGGKASYQQLYEVARSLDSMIAKGASTNTGLEHIFPDSLKADMAKTQSYVNGKPVMFDVKDYMKLFKDTVDREKGVSNDAIKEYQNKALSSYKDLKKKDPEKWDEIMSSHGLIPPKDQDDAAAAPKTTPPREWTPGG